MEYRPIIAEVKVTGGEHSKLAGAWVRDSPAHARVRAAQLLGPAVSLLVSFRVRLGVGLGEEGSVKVVKRTGWGGHGRGVVGHWQG